MEIKDLKGKLFSVKEMYEMSCSLRGKLPLINGSAHQKRKAQYDNLHLTSGMNFTESGFPILKPYRGSIDFTPILYNDRNKYSGHGQFVHFFSDDYKWGNSIWNGLESKIYALRKFDGMFTPDYSLYVDEGFRMFNMIQTYKSRFVGAFAQNVGYNVIPTASFGDADSLEYSFEGLPERSVIGFCGTGLSSHSLQSLWEYAIRTLEEMKTPSLIIVYGPERKVPGLRTPIKFIQDQISKYHRHGKSFVI